MTDEQIRALIRVKELELGIAKAKREREIILSENRIDGFKPYWYQQEVLDMFHKGKRIVCCPNPNKMGKTALLACLALSWCYGYEPWTASKEKIEGGICINSTWFKRSSLGKEPPVKIRITGEDWENQIKTTVLPELKYWAKKGSYKTKSNNQGIEYLWTFYNGSSIQILTYKMEPEQFESWLGDAWLPDEPPPKHVWDGMSRGLFMSNGKVYLASTPLKEAWILDDIVLSGRADVGVIRDLSLWDNPDLYAHDKGVLVKCGLLPEEADEWLEKQKKACRISGEQQHKGEIKRWTKELQERIKGVMVDES